jgi:hypothetical protein
MDSRRNHRPLNPRRKLRAMADTTKPAKMIRKSNGPWPGQEVEIPAGFVCCETCDGSGQTSCMGGFGYPMTRYYDDCWRCAKRGYVAARYPGIRGIDKC